eukprot:1158918-Pelagomonas_calceolata.AAC.8
MMKDNCSAVPSGAPAQCWAVPSLHLTAREYRWHVAQTRERRPVLLEKRHHVTCACIACCAGTGTVICGDLCCLKGAIMSHVHALHVAQARAR